MANPSPAWDDNLLQNPHTVADKRRRVQQMFAAIAPKYDFNNRLHSFGRDQAWRRKAVELAGVKLGDRVVDIACGTGDLTLAFFNALTCRDPWGDVLPKREELIGIDFTYEMLPVAVGKSSPEVKREFEVERLRSVAQYINGDAQALPLPDASADVVSIAFGIRNVQDVNAALREFHRVLRPGGRVIILEFSRPRNRVIRFFNDLYCARIMPHTATWISGDKSGAYKYLPMSVQSFIDRDEMVAKIRDVGFTQVEQFPMTFGVCVCYRGVKT
ncbi:MAG TPA: bifunctional demethylmenaquinone methyltransferase/2-methoxy-6-polyprenyl-1,4-benzoquinol methylase UbiE [Tepidisphaeraceae bacterium]|jgi:demethylmenaquinone methyltransferase/2-methoxy-6-polyprenyl-1,4-benzoquinol methylase|nr:bifunctional demethylmenaquinone methyltransferase/2-methoxy-6-polyprenyl-1,4-benzoquinol methylase UbiE [Tepidisphaeraceae bacterium]